MISDFRGSSFKIQAIFICFVSLFDPQTKLGSAKGGPYLGVHLRRKDFIWGHREDVPSLKGAVKKIRSLMKKHKLDKVFVATDADGEGNDIPAQVYSLYGEISFVILMSASVFCKL